MKIVYLEHTNWIFLIYSFIFIELCKVNNSEKATKVVHFYLTSHKKQIPIFHGDELSKFAKGSNKKIMFFLLKSRRL